MALDSVAVKMPVVIPPMIMRGIPRAGRESQKTTRRSDGGALLPARMLMLHGKA